MAHQIQQSLSMSASDLHFIVNFGCSFSLSGSSQTLPRTLDFAFLFGSKLGFSRILDKLYSTRTQINFSLLNGIIVTNYFKITRKLNYK